MTRISRILRARWWVLGLAILAGVAGGVAFAQGTEGPPIYEAELILPVEAESDSTRGESSSGGTDQTRNSGALRDQAEIATEANADLVARGRGQIETDDQRNELLFKTKAASEEAALSLAETMRDNYLFAVTNGLTPQEQMDSLMDEAVEIQELLLELQPVEELDQPELDATEQARFDFINAQVQALTQESSRLWVDLILAEAGNDRVGSVEDIQSQLDAVQESLQQLYEELAAMGFTSSDLAQATSGESRTEDTGARTNGPTGVDVEQDWQIQALEERYQELESEFQSLYMKQNFQPPEELPTATITNITSPGGSLGTNSLLGALGGLVLGAGLVFAEDRARKRTWSSSDLRSAPVLAEVPVARPPTRWQLAKFHRARLAAIRALRGWMVGLIDNSPRRMVVGMTGLGVAEGAVRELTTDLAAAIGATDRSVILMDFGSEPDGDDPGDRVTVANILAQPRDDPQAVASLAKTAVSDAMEVSPRVRELPAGKLSPNAPDAILSPTFSTLLEEARNQSDVTLVVAPDRQHPVTQALVQRLDGMVAVCHAGKTSTRELERMGGAQADRSARLLGAVLLVGRWRQNTLGLGTRVLRDARSVIGRTRGLWLRHRGQRGRRVNGANGKGNGNGESENGRRSRALHRSDGSIKRLFSR